MRSGTVVILDGAAHPSHDFGRETAAWESIGLDVVLAECRSESDIAAAAARADAVAFWGLDVPLTRNVLEKLHTCRLVTRYGIGVDSVDVSAATDHGIVVAAPTEYCVPEVADHACALLLGLARRTVYYDRVIQGGGWRTAVPLTSEIRRLADSTLGLVGLGRTARRVAAIMASMVDTVVATDPQPDPGYAASARVELISLNELLARSDLVSVHAPLLPETRGMIGAAELARMKPTAYLVNTSRGALIDERALADALTDGVIAGAGLDVFETEPLPPDNPLRGQGNVVLTPHVAGSSEQAKADLYDEVTAIIADTFRGFWPRGVRNPSVTPKVQLNPSSAP